jgi:hypothetical protein
MKSPAYADAGQVSGVKAEAHQAEGLALPAQEPGERGALAARGRRGRLADRR